MITMEEYTRQVNLNIELSDKIRQLEKENNDLRRIYQNTYKKYLESGNDEMARYFMAQIDACPTFYVAPIIDYYKEYYKLKGAIKDAIEVLKLCDSKCSKEVINILDMGVPDVTAN